MKELLAVPCVLIDRLGEIRCSASPSNAVERLASFMKISTVKKPYFRGVIVCCTAKIFRPSWIKFGMRNSPLDFEFCEEWPSEGIKSRWGQDFFARIQTGAEAHSASYTVSTAFFPVGKAAGAWR